MFSIFNAPRNYPKVYMPYYDKFNFYDGRDVWLKSIENIPQKAVYLFAINWLHLELYNGGFWQYFYNSTSNSLSEAIEGFNQIGMADVASLIEEAAKKVGEPFPYDRDKRKLIVGEPNNKLDFDELNNKFYEFADTNKFFRKKPKFVDYADTYANLK